MSVFIIHCMRTICCTIKGRTKPTQTAQGTDSHGIMNTFPEPEITSSYDSKLYRKKNSSDIHMTSLKLKMIWIPDHYGTIISFTSHFNSQDHIILIYWSYAIQEVKLMAKLPCLYDNSTHSSNKPTMLMV